MRIASILAASGVIGWLFRTLWTLHGSRLLLLYTGWMFVITLTATLVARYIPQDDRGYGTFYTVMLGPLCLFVFLTASEFAISLGQNGLIGLLVFLVLTAFFVVLFWEHATQNLYTKVMLAQAHIFGTCGLLTLASAVPPCSALQFRLRLILGSYWLSVSVYSFCQTLGILRAYALWRSLDSWFASALCVVFLGGLGLALRGAQPESARQQIRGQAVAYAPGMGGDRG